MNKQLSSRGDSADGAPDNRGSGSGGSGGDKATGVSATPSGSEAPGANESSGGGSAFSPLISGIRDLPETGGVPLILGVVGALLVIGGLLFRKVFR